MSLNRYLLQPSEKSGYLVCTDQENLIVCTFQEHHFNSNQKFSTLEGFPPGDVMKLARLGREMGEWLAANHYDKAF